MKTGLRIGLIAIVCLAVIGSALLSVPMHSEARGAVWSVSVYGNPDLAGSTIWVGVSPAINYAWGTGAPVINGANTGAPVDNFSIRFTSSVFFTAGTYRFTAQVDDGMRLYVDGMLLINAWTDGLKTVQGDYAFTSDGYHTVIVEMYESVGDASILMSWAMISTSTSPVVTTPTVPGIPWYANFYSGLDLAGSALFSTTYGPSGLSLNWGQGTPGGAVPVDNWSARFTRTLNVPTDLVEGGYTFYAKADDNFRFYIDGTLIFDYWDTFANGQLYSAPVTLLNGSHTFTYEYRERELDAVVFLTWDPPGAQNPPLLPSASGSTVTTGGSTVTTTNITATVNVWLLNFRATPDLNGVVLTKLPKGTSYPVVGRSGDNLWVQLLVDGGTGWVYAQYVTLSGDINTLPVVAGTEYTPPEIGPTGVFGRVMGNLRIRAEPTTASDMIGLMPWGTEIEILGKDEGHWWYLLRYGDVLGWAYAPWIWLIEGSLDQVPYMDGTQPEYTPAPATEGVIAQAFGNMRIRSGPGFQYPKIDRAIWGSQVQVVGWSTDGLWYKVRYGDIVGWSYAAWYRIVQGEILTVPVTDQ